MQSSIVILAAGGSSRLGEPKQLLRYHGRTLLEHACHLALEAGPDLVLAVLGHEALRLGSAIPDRVQSVLNPEWSSGLSSSIRAGLRALPPEIEVAVLTLVDQPLITSEHLRALIEITNERSPVAASQYPDGHPGVPAAFHRSVFPELMQLKGDAGAKAVLVRQPDLRIIPAPPLLDVDTREEYDLLTQLAEE